MRGFVANCAVTCAAIGVISACCTVTSLADDKTLGNPTPSVRYYTAKSGDNLSNIARVFGVSLRELVFANHLTNGDRILAGSRLIIPATAPATGSRPYFTFSSLDGTRSTGSDIGCYAHVDVLMTPGAKGIVFRQYSKPDGR